MSKQLTGKEIKAFRESIGMNQKEFATKLGFNSYGWLSAIENGKASVSARTTIIFLQIKDSYLQEHLKSI